MNLSFAAGNLVQVNHLIQFNESMSNPTNKPKWEPHAKKCASMLDALHML